MVQANQSMDSPNRRDLNSVGIADDDEVAEGIYLEVSVDNPITRKSRESGELVTTYAIYIEHPSVSVPKLPGKTFLGKRFDQRFIQERCYALQVFLKTVVEQPVFLSNKSLHLFLQSSLTMDRVQNVVNGGQSFELPHNNAPLILCPVDNGNRANNNGLTSILKQESCGSLTLASGIDHECCIKKKHRHIRVGSGIIVCPYIPGEQHPIASSAPFNIPGKQNSPVNLRSCAGDTCLDGATSAGSSQPGSKKKVSFLIDKENKRTIMKKVVEAHCSSQEISG